MLSAITDGSLRTMPRPRAYTSVFAVPRSIARSLATASAVVVAPVGRQCAHLALELLDAVVDRRGSSVAHVQHERAEHAHHDGDEEEREPASHWESTWVSSVAAKPQSSPPAQRSFFQ